MKKTKLIVIGGNAAGMSAASKVRRANPDHEIIVFERTDYTSYSACGIPYFISGKVKEADDLIVRSPKVFKEKYNIDARINHEVLEIDTDNQKLKVRNLKDKSEFWETYDQLLIATGSRAFCPDVEGMGAKGIFGVTTLKSGIKVEQFILKEKPKQAVIIGGGYIGIEMAEALIIRGIKVTIINRSAQVMGTLDPDMGALVYEALKKIGVVIHLNEALESFTTENGQVIAVVTKKQTIKTDMVILGIGSQPNTALLKNTKIKLGTTGAIKVNKKMQTNITNVWAAGDCVETQHLISKKAVNIALGTVANKTGLVAGSNMVGQEITFPGVVGTAVCKICDYEVARTGLTEKELKQLHMDYITATVDSLSRAGYYPGSTKITVKLLADKKTGRLFGGQIVGQEGAAKRIDVLATALTAKLNLQQIIDLDLSYAPPFSLVWDPVQTAARKLISQMK